MPEGRTKEAALTVLLSFRAEVVAAQEDIVVQKVVTDNLVRDVLQLAWQYQFSEDDSAFEREVRSLVSDGVVDALDESGSTE